jgi:hypothetical protein
VKVVNDFDDKKLGKEDGCDDPQRAGKIIQQR